MRILLAIDGSPPAERAVELVANTPWGEAPSVRVIEVVPTVIDPFGVPMDDVVEQEVTAAMEGTLASAADRLRRTGATVERSAVSGRPADAILSSADDFGADLLVLGHRGRGAVASRLLGSVAAEVAERSTRAVLVVRRPTVGNVVLGHDGSAEAREAERIVAEWPAFHGSAVTVVSVGHVLAPLASGVWPGVRHEAMAAQREDVARELAEHARIADGAAAALGKSGLEATPLTVVGDPGDAIIRTAVATAAGTIVVGNRGRGRFGGLLGTTARTVIFGAPCSVLVVHVPPASGEGRGR